MSSHQFQAIDSTGEVIGKFASAVQVEFHGWMFSNSGAAVYEVDFYTSATPAGGRAPATPSASGTKVFTIQVPATSSKEYFEDAGIVFPNGLFAIANNAAVTGGVVYS